VEVSVVPDVKNSLLFVMIDVILGVAELVNWIRGANPEPANEELN